MYTVERATHKNELFKALRTEWVGRLASYNEDPAFFAVPYLDHADKIAAEKPAPKNYGIFLLKDQHGNFHGLFHANVAGLPKTKGTTLRILWILYAPRYEYEDVNESDLALLVSSLLTGAIALCKESMVANHIKIRLESAAERRFAHGLAYNLRDKDLDGCLVETRGNWLHIDNVQKP